MALPEPPSKLSAFLAGMWTMLGMSTFGWWIQHYSVGGFTRLVLSLAVISVFFFVPLFVFVSGRPTLSTADSRRHTFKQAGVRVLLWFLGAVAFGAVYVPLLSSLFSSS